MDKSMDGELVKTGIDIIGPVPWGTHFCQFYQTKEDLLDTLVPFFAAGLENNEFCMWVTAEPLSSQEADEAMRRAMPDFADRLARGQIEVIPHTEWYLKGGSFDLGRVLNGWVEKLGIALAKGYQGLRVTGNTAWLERRDWDSFAGYEAAINGVIGKHRMMALCTYSLDRCNAADVVDVLRNHEFALIRKRDKWELIENAIYKQTKESLGQIEERFRGVLEELPLGIELYDADGRLVSANSACLEIFGVSAFDDIRGYGLFEDPNVPEHMKAQLRRGKAARFESTFDFDKVRKHKTYGTTRSGAICLDLMVTPIVPRDGKPLGGYLVQVQDVTERKRAEESLRRSAELLTRAEMIAHVGSWELDLVKNELTWSDQVYRIFGQQPREFGATYEAFMGAVHPDDRAAVDSAYSGSLREGRDTYEIEHRVVRKSTGEIRVVHERCEHVRDRSGRVVRSVGMVQDITERKQAEKQLQFQANTLAHIFDAVVVVDNYQKVTYWNEVAQGLYGVPVDQAIGQKLEDLYRGAWLNPDDEQDSAEDLAAKGHWTGENIHIKNNGEMVYVRSSVSVMRDQHGVQTGMVSVIRDQTKLWQAEQEVKLLNERLRQEAEDRLRATDASFRRAITSSADGIVVASKDGIIRFANPAAAELLGWSPGEMMGTLFRFPLSEGTEEMEIPRGDGERSTAEMRVVELDWDGAPAYLATLRDITRRKRDLLALQESETRLRLLLDQIPCVSWTLDTRLRFASFTGSGVGVFKIVPAQILGMTLADYFKVDSPDFTPYVAHRQALRGTPATYELNWGGRTFYGRVESLKDADDHIVGVVGVAFDITDRKQAEEQLRNLSHRLVTAQENERRKIARELHDEVGQSLTALKLSLDKASLSGSAGDGSGLGEAREALRELMARVRSMSLELRPTMLDDLGLLPTLLWHFKRYTAQTNVRVRFKHRGLRKDLPQDVVTAAYRIVQEALTNVARHARVSEVLVCVRAEYDALVVEVEDQGVGFDHDRIASASMGLNGMRERALSLKGKLLVQAKPGEGTCVIAELPIAKRRRKGARSKSNDNRSSG